jgi:hypothetical protein
MNTPDRRLLLAFAVALAGTAGVLGLETWWGHAGHPPMSRLALFLEAVPVVAFFGTGLTIIGQRVLQPPEDTRWITLTLCWWERIVWIGLTLTMLYLSFVWLNLELRVF